MQIDSVAKPPLENDEVVHRIEALPQRGIGYHQLRIVRRGHRPLLPANGGAAAQ
jgi:hypothetical protein